MFNIKTWLMTNYTQNGPQKSWQVETPSRVGKSRCSFLFFDVFVLHWWMTARCTMLSSGGLPSNREIAHVCAGYASSFPAWKRTYHWLTNCSLQGGVRLKRQNQYLEVVGSSSSVPLEETVSMLVWIARALKPIAARGLAHWRRSRCIDGVLGHQMTNESESVKCSPGPLSQPIHLTLQTPSRSNGLIGEEKYKLRSYPSANPRNPKLKAGVTEVHWSIEIKQPFLSLSDSQALQINGATGLLLQVDTGWDKWHCG